MAENIMVCPKHRIVMKNGSCRMCQAEYYDKYYRKYGTPTTSLESETIKKDVKAEKQHFKNNNKSKDRPITENDLDKLLNKFGKK